MLSWTVSQTRSTVNSAGTVLVRIRSWPGRNAISIPRLSSRTWPGADGTDKTIWALAGLVTPSRAANHGARCGETVDGQDRADLAGVQERLETIRVGSGDPKRRQKILEASMPPQVPQLVIAALGSTHRATPPLDPFLVQRCGVPGVRIRHRSVGESQVGRHVLGGERVPARRLVELVHRCYSSRTFAVGVAHAERRYSSGVIPNFRRNLLRSVAAE